MLVKVFDDKLSLAKAAAGRACEIIREAIRHKGAARIIAATGNSQIDFLDILTQAPAIDWQRVELFHLDEYIGLPVTHPASFRKYLFERLIHKTGITRYRFIDGEGDPVEVIARVGAALTQAPVDVAFVGIGENGHLAFNDPPANLETNEPYLVVSLDEACRRQQVGEGWFANLSEVPQQAISMSIRQILKAKEILAIVPETRKAAAVKACLEGEITPMTPASILRTHSNVMVFLDKDSAALLRPAVRESARQHSPS